MTQLLRRQVLSNTFTDGGTFYTDDVDLRVNFSSIFQTVFSYSGLTNVVITIQGTINGTDYTDMDVQTVTESGDLMFCISLCPVPTARVRVVFEGTGDFILTTNISKVA